MNDLIARLQAATEGSRELDDAIMEIVGDNGLGLLFRGCYSWRFTTSLDAALMLVPEGWQWITRNDEGRSDAFANVLRGRDEEGNYESRHPCWAATPALALCIAALKARAAQAEPAQPRTHFDEMAQEGSGV